MNKILFGILLVIALVLGYFLHKPQIKIVEKEVIPKNKQCYDNPLEIDKICYNYLEPEIKKIQAEADAQKQKIKEAEERNTLDKDISQKNMQMQLDSYKTWLEGYKEGFSKGMQKWSQ